MTIDINISKILQEQTTDLHALFCVEDLTSNMINIIPRLSESPTFCRGLMPVWKTYYYSFYPKFNVDWEYHRLYRVKMNPNKVSFQKVTGNHEPTFIYSFVPNSPFLHHLKTENCNVFSCFQIVEKGCIGNKWGNISLLVFFLLCITKRN